MVIIPVYRLAVSEKTVTVMTMNSSQFQKSFEKLDPQQRKAVSQIEGTVMVLAGPGTGKTQVVAMRIANILLKTQLNPSNILALTFTEAGVTALRQRLIGLIGSTGYQVKISTFHGFAGEVIAIFPHLFTQTESLRQIRDAERFLLIEQIITESNDLTHLRPLRKSDLYVSEISQKIKTLKQENVSPTQLKKLVKIDPQKPDLAKRLIELVKIYQSYNQALTERGWYDYEDTIQFVVEAISSNSEVKAYFQEKYQYILVDEFQDTNNSQNALVSALANFFDEPNLFVVGDDKQAIYRFQGASVANLLQFKDCYPALLIINLLTNYRSTPQILTVADKLIRHNQTQIKLPSQSSNIKLKATVAKGSKAKLIEADSTLASYSYLVSRIKTLEKSGTELSQIAVLWRRRQDAAEFSQFAQKSELVVSGQIEVNLFSNPTVRSLLKLLSAIADPTDNISVLKALIPLLTDRQLVDLYKLQRSTKSSSILIEKVTKATGDLKKYANLIWEGHRRSESASIDELLGWLIEETPFISARLSSKDNLTRVEILLAFFEQAKNYARQEEQSLPGFIAYCQMLERKRLEVPITKLLPASGVFVGTVHSAKGLEFDHVFMAGVDEKRWSLRKKPDVLKLPSAIVGLVDWEDNLVEDERRLFYVGTTRAKYGLEYVYSNTNTQDETLLPCQFISEIESELVQTKLAPAGDELAKNTKRLLTPLANSITSKIEIAYARSLIANSPFSFSDMQSFQVCPRQYYLNRVLKFPRQPTESLIYGIIVHKILEQTFREFKSYHNLPSAKRYKEIINQTVEKLSPQQWRSQLAEHVENVMGAYYKQKSSGWKIPAGIEYSFTHHQVRLNNINLTGKIDRLDYITGRSVRVIDYKTKSRPISRNVIEGKTKTSDGSIKDQLVFYGLLSSLDHNFPFDVAEYQISVIDDKLGFADEIIPISNPEISAMKKRVIETFQQILSTKEFTHSRSEFDQGCEICQIYS